LEKLSAGAWVIFGVAALLENTPFELYTLIRSGSLIQLQAATRNAIGDHEPTHDLEICRDHRVRRTCRAEERWIRNFCSAMRSHADSAALVAPPASAASSGRRMAARHLDRFAQADNCSDETAPLTADRAPLGKSFETDAYLGGTESSNPLPSSGESGELSVPKRRSPISSRTTWPSAAV
jgi:hypothetical protein